MFRSLLLGIYFFWKIWDRNVFYLYIYFYLFSWKANCLNSVYWLAFFPTDVKCRLSYMPNSSIFTGLGLSSLLNCTCLFVYLGTILHCFDDNSFEIFWDLVEQLSLPSSPTASPPWSSIIYASKRLIINFGAFSLELNI